MVSPDAHAVHVPFPADALNMPTPHSWNRPIALTYAPAMATQPAEDPTEVPKAAQPAVAQVALNWH